MPNIEDLTLRSTTQAPFTTKGEALTLAEGDQNLIIIGQSIIALNNATLISAWAIGAAYTSSSFVLYDDKLWKGLASSTGVQPGTDDTKWRRASIGELAHLPNKDTKIDEGGANEVTAAQLKPIVTDLGGISDKVASGISLLVSAIGMNFNSTSDTIVALSGGTTFLVTMIVITNASVNMTTADDFEMWTSAARTGTKLFSTNFISNLTAAADYISSDAGGITLDTRKTLSAGNLYLSLGTPQGATATADVYIYGTILN